MARADLYLRFRAEVFKEEGLYVAVCPELDVYSFGVTVDEAKESLREAVEAFIEGGQHLGTLEEVLQEAGFQRENETWVTRELVAEETLVAVG